MAGKDQQQEADKGITPSQTVGPFFAYGPRDKNERKFGTEFAGDSERVHAVEGG